MKTTRIALTVSLMALLFVTTACQQMDEESLSKNSTAAKRGVAMIELNDGSMVELNCLVAAAKQNVDPKQMCSRVISSQVRGVSSSREAVTARGTCKKKCGDTNTYYTCNTGNCGWNDFYASPYYSNYYYSYNPNQYGPSTWQNQFGIPNSYYYQYMYSYSYQAAPTPYQNYYQTQYPSYSQGQNCGHNGGGGSAWYGGDFTRYGSCWSNVYWR